MKKSAIIKATLLLITCMMFMGTVCFAAGHAVSVLTRTEKYKTYSSIIKLDEASEKIGFSVNAPASFSNGYEFSGMSVDKCTKLDQEGNKIGTYQELRVQYAMSEMTDITLTETQPLHYIPGRTGDLIRGIGGVEVSYYTDTYQFVPENYTLSQEDNENLQHKDYVIRHGTQNIQITKISYVDWEKEGIHYNIMSFDTTLTSDEMFAMAEELI